MNFIENFAVDFQPSASYDLPGFVSVFQAGLTVLQAYRWLGHDLSPKRNIVTLTDIQVAIKALHSVATSFRLVEQYRNALNSWAARSKSRSSGFYIRET